MRRAINGYSDVFRTQGEMKKSLREVDEFEEELNDAEKPLKD